MSLNAAYQGTKKALEVLAGTLLSVSAVFWVDSSADRAANTPVAGQKPETPFSTLAYACAAAAIVPNCIIMVGAGHTETISAAGGVTIADAGVQIIGLGNWTKRPKFTLGTLTTATFKINAADVSIKNCQFSCAVDSLVKMFDVNADGFTMEDCYLYSASGTECLSFINIATDKDYVTLRRCEFFQPTDPAGSNGGANTGAIYCVDTEHVRVIDCRFEGYFETAVLHNKTTAMKYLDWRGNTVRQLLTDAARILTPAGTVGMSFGPDADYVPGMGYPARRAAAVLPANTTTAYFAVVGGTVRVNQLMGEVTTVCSATVTNLKVQANPTATGSSVDMCADLAIANAPLAQLWGITGTLATALQGGLAIVGQSTGTLVQIGTIDFVTNATNTGAAKWTCWWTPIDTSLGIPNVIAI